MSSVSPTLLGSRVSFVRAHQRVIILIWASMRDYTNTPALARHYKFTPLQESSSVSFTQISSLAGACLCPLCHSDQVVILTGLV